MRRRLIVAIAIVAALAVLLLLVRSTLDPEVIRRAAEARLSVMLGQPVSIGAVRVSIGLVPDVVGSDIVIGPRRDSPELALERIRIVPRLLSLFRGPYVMRDVALEGLTVRIVREPSGRWKFPALLPVPGTDESSGLTVEQVRLTGGQVRVFELTARDGPRETSRIDGIEATAVAGASGLRASPMRGRVGGAAITAEASLSPEEARLDFTLPEITGGDLAAVLGLAATEPPGFLGLPRPAAVSMSIRIDRVKSRLSGKGSLRAPEVGFYALRLQGVEAPINTDGVKLNFDPVTFTMYGGTHRGSMRVELSPQRARWALDSTVSSLNVGQFLAALAGAGRIHGTASVKGSLQGGVGEPMPEGLEGRMHVDVVNGIIREFPLLAAVNRALQLAEGDARDTRFERLFGTLVFAGRSGSSAGASGHVRTDDLVMQAREVRVEARGRIGFDRSLDLSGEAILSPERSASAIRSVRELTGLRNDRGEIELPLKISGSIDSPSFAIDLKAVIGRSLEEELRRRIRRFIRR